METYDVTFSPRRSENEERLTGSEMPCYICGKGVRTNKYWARISDGGSSITTDEYADRPENRAGDLANYPIGPECYRKLPAEAKKLVKIGMEG